MSPFRAAAALAALSVVMASCTSDDGNRATELRLTALRVGAGGSSLDVTWTPPVAAEGYVLTIDDPETDIIDLSVSVHDVEVDEDRNVATTAQAIPVDLAGSPVEVQLLDPTGRSLDTAEVQLTAPGTPVLLAFDAAEIEVQWAADPAATEYTVWAQPRGEAWSTVATAAADETSAMVGNPAPEGSVRLGVSAVQAGAEDVATGSVIIPIDVGWDPRTVAMGAGAVSARPSIGTAAGVVHVAPDGDDDGDGSEGSPFRTIAHAVTEAPDNATVVVHEGVYRESIGDVFRPVRLVVATGEQVIVSGADPVDTAWSPDGRGLWTTPFASPLPQPGGSGYEIVADQIDPATPASGHLKQLFVDGVSLEQVVDLADVVSRDDVFAYDDDLHQLVLGFDPADRTVETSTRALGLKLHPGDGDGGAQGSELTGLIFTASAPLHQDGYAAVIIDAPDVTVTDLTVSQSSATGLAVYAPGVELTRVTASDNGARGITANEADGLSITFSRVDRNNAAGFDYQDCGGGTHCVVAGLKVTWTEGLTVAHSSFSDNQATGLWCDLACVGATLIGNSISGNAKHGLFYEVSRQATISGNVITGHDSPGTVGLRLVGSDDVAVVRNTFDGNLTDLEVSDDPREPGQLADFGVDTDPSGIEVTGNLFAESPDLVDRVGDRAILETGEPSSTSPTPSRFDSYDRNAYALSSNVEGQVPYRFRWINADGSLAYRSSVDGFTEATGLDRGSTVIDSRAELPFVGAEVGDYRLRAGAFSQAGLVEAPPVDGVPGLDGDIPPGIGAWYLAG